MAGLNTICALLLAGGIGAGSVVAVQKVAPVVSKPRPKPAKQVQKTATPVQNVAPTPSNLMLDCPLPTATLSTVSIDGLDTSHSKPFLAPLAGPVSLPTPIVGVDAVAPVPEPNTWLYMLSGFGLVCFALRRRSQQPVLKVTN